MLVHTWTSSKLLKVSPALASCFASMTTSCLRTLIFHLQMPVKPTAILLNSATERHSHTAQLLKPSAFANALSFPVLAFLSFTFSCFQSSIRCAFRCCWHPLSSKGSAWEAGGWPGHIQGVYPLADRTSASQLHHREAILTALTLFLVSPQSPLHLLSVFSALPPSFLSVWFKASSTP